MHEADIATGLRQAARQEGVTVADAAVATVPAEPSVEAPSSEPASDTLTTAPETPAETPEAQAAEPSESLAEPEPAGEPAEQSFDLAEALKSTGIDISRYASPQEALPHVLKQLRSKIAEQGEKLKSASAAPSPAAETTQAQAQPQAPAPPAPAAPVTEQINAEVKERLTKDREVVHAVQTYRANDERIQTISTKELPEIEKRISRLEAHLPENARSEGLPEPDEVTAAELRSKINDLRAQHRLLRLEAVDLNQVNKEIRSGYQARETFYRNEIEGRYQEALNQERENQRIEQEAESFVGLWKDNYSTVIGRLGVTDEETKAEIWNQAANEARLDPSVVGNDLAGYIERVGKRILERNDRIRRDAARVTAQRKAGDVKPQAPAGPAAVAPPRPTTTDKSDPFAALRAAERARHGAPA